MVLPRYPFYGNPAVYVDPTIVSFVAAPALAEIGSTVDRVVLKWSIAKDPSNLTVDGIQLGINQRSTLKTGPFTTNQSWSMKAGDEHTSYSAKATLAFVNRIYFGFVTAAPADSAGIMALENNQLSSTRKGYVTIGEPPDKVFCYAYPKRLGMVKVTRDASSDLWQPTTKTDTLKADTDYTVTTVSFTNASGYTEDYYVVTLVAAQPGSTVLHFS